jgi:putative transcriptional regulator
LQDRRVPAPRDAKAPRDERDKLIELRAMRVAYAGLATSVALACFFGAFNPPILFNTNALLFILVTTEMMRSACRIVQYRVVPDMGAIRNETRRLRFEHGEMTQQELAEKINLTRQTVNAIEQGKYSPSLEAAFRISAVFGKPLESVFHYSQGRMSVL